MPLSMRFLLIVCCLFIASTASAQVEPGPRADRRTRAEFLEICASEDVGPDVLADFLSRGVDVDLKDRGGDTALLMRARRGDLESCRLLLDWGADVDLVDSKGLAALAHARLLGLPELERMLVDAGAKETMATVMVTGQTTVLGVMRMRPLSIEACAAAIDAIREAGFDVADLGGEELLCSVARNCADPAGCDLVIEAGVVPTDVVLFCAAMNPSPDVMRRLLDRGLDVNVTDERFTTPFFRAASYNPEPEMLRMLVEAGAEVDVRDEDGDTPLHKAAFGNIGGPAIVDFLLGLGMDPDVRNHEGSTPLATACVFGNPRTSGRIIRSLIDAGADVDARTTVDDEGRGGVTPVLIAAAGLGRSLDGLRLLVAAGADVNARAAGRFLQLEKGQNAVFPAILSSNEEILPLLIELGADVNAVDENGLTPLDVAMGRGRWIEQPWAVELLRAAGAKTGSASTDPAG